MPSYTYSCMNCNEDTTKICSIASRDSQMCGKCGYRLNRGIDRPGLVWAPTAGGMR